MATVREWADGYLAQGRADLRGAQSMGTASPSCLAMLLQMVFEKYAKAALLRSNAVALTWAQGNHGAASRMLLVLRRQRALMEPLGGTRVWEDVLWVVGALEQAHPQFAPAGGPQLEYPWEDVHGDIRWPERDLRIALTLGDADNNLSTRVLRFATLLSERFDEIFP